MTTENEIVETQDRSVSELLQLDTYQGMTDSEIESLIAHKAYILLSENTNAAVVNSMNIQMAYLNNLESEVYTAAVTQLNTLLTNPPAFSSV